MTMRERFALRQSGDAAEPVAGRVEVARGSGIAAVAIGGQPLLGGEGVEALADDSARPSASRTATRSPDGATMTS